MTTRDWKNRTKDITALNLSEENLSDESAAFLAKSDEKFGFVPNIFKAYSFENSKLMGFLGFWAAMVRDEVALSDLQKEMIAVVVSSQNRCYYCLTSHGAALRALSSDPELAEALVMNFRAAKIDKQTRAMLNFAVRLTTSPAEIVEDDRQSLRDAGFGDREIFAIATIAAHYNMTNRAAVALDLRPNTEYIGMAR